jgi:tetratricopeptide (TPR) repeat protein
MSSNFLRSFLLSLFLSFIFFDSVQSNDKKPNIDSLLGIIESEDLPDSVVMRAYFRLSWDLKSAEPEKSLDYAKKALEIAETLNQPGKVADALSGIGVIYWQMGNFNMALDTHLEALDIYSGVEDETGIARSNTNIGIIFLDKGYYDKAVEYFYQALLIYERKDNSAGMAVVLNNLGMISEYQKDFDLAEKYHLQSLELKQKSGDVKGMAFSYNNLGLVYQGKQMFEKAMEYFNLALDIREKLNDKREVANTCSRIGYLYFLMKDFQQSKTNLSKALNLYNEVNDKNGIAKAYNYLGILYMHTNELNNSRKYFTMSLEMAQNIGQSKMILENFSGMALLMAKMGNYEKAFELQKRFIDMKDSIYNEDSRRKTIELKLMYDREKKESEMQLNQQIHFLSSQKNRLLKNFLIAGVVLVLVSLFLLYNRFLIAKNANTLLENQKNEITLSNDKLISLNNNLLEQKKKSEELNHQLQLSNQKLKESESHLIEINSTKDKFFSIISHDLRNPFAAIVSFSRILKRDIENLTVKELKDLALELDKSVLKINNLLENLLQWSRTQTGKIRYEPEYIAIHEIVKDNLILFKNNAKEKKITLIDLVDDNTPVWADRNMTDTVIRISYPTL